MSGNVILLEFKDISGGNFSFISDRWDLSPDQHIEYVIMMERIGLILRYRKNTINLLRRIILNSKGAYSGEVNDFPLSIWVDDIFCVDFSISIKASIVYLNIDRIRYFKDGYEFVLHFSQSFKLKYSTQKIGISYEKFFNARTFIKDNTIFDKNKLISEIEDFMLDYTTIDNYEDIIND